jgi:hypothetical protein
VALLKVNRQKQRQADPGAADSTADEGSGVQAEVVNDSHVSEAADSGASETAAGALAVLALTPENRDTIAHAQGIKPLISLFDGGSDAATEQAALALQRMVVENTPNQLAIVNEAVAMLRGGSAEAQEHVAALLRNLAQDPENRSAIAKAGAVPELVRQLEMGSEKAMGMAASGLALIALKSESIRVVVSNELVKLLSSDKEGVRQRAAEALTDMAAGESANPKHRAVVTNGVPVRRQPRANPSKASRVLSHARAKTHLQSPFARSIRHCICVRALARSS